MMSSKTVNKLDVRNLFKKHIPEVVDLALRSQSEHEFIRLLGRYAATLFPEGRNTKRLLELIENEGCVVHEISREEEVRLETISLLWHFLVDTDKGRDVSVDYALDIYHFLLGCKMNVCRNLPDESLVNSWMCRWPDGMEEQVLSVRKENKARIINLLIQKIEHRKSAASRYVFPAGCSDEKKRELVEEWWNDYHFHLAMAVKTPKELNLMLGNTLNSETLQIYHRAQAKGIPVFITPYYLSLLNSTGKGYDDAAIRSYVIYSSKLVDTFGKIKAWEREDMVEPGKPNVAGWLLPDGHNIHRRYPDVAILIPDTRGRSCGGLCASCQRMYDFQSRRLNFDLENLKPRENWKTKLSRLMEYFEHDTQLRDILITGGDALMSENATLRHLLNAVYKMAVRKREANVLRSDGEKYAELQRVRLGTRLPVYLPMRINDELLDVLREFREKASAKGVRQFFIQTHFQSPLEVTLEVRDALQKLMSTGWTITNQLVYNVPVSRRGHTAKLRKVLNDLGVICYYTFSVKGFEENYEVFTPNSRSLQEACEEKRLGIISREKEMKLSEDLLQNGDTTNRIGRFCIENNIPFLATDRNVLNLPGIGKSMTFKLAGISADGRRVLCFSHDTSRRHSPVIAHQGNMYIIENKSIWCYLLQLHDLGEDIGEYSSIWDYIEGKTEPRFSFFEYPDAGICITNKFSNLME